MTKAKRTVSLIGGILGIVMGALAVLSFILSIVVIAPALGDLSTLGEDVMALMIVSLLMMLVMMGIGIATIVCGAKICPNPSKKPAPTEYKGLSIAMIVLNVLFLICCLIGGLNGFLAIIEFILSLAGIGLFIAALCMPKDVAAATPAAAPAAEPTAQPTDAK